MRLNILAVIFLFALSNYSLADDSSRCEIKVTYYLKSGAIEKEIFHPKAKNKNQCFKKSQAYKANLVGSKVKKKNVAVRWKAAAK